MLGSHASMSSSTPAPSSSSAAPASAPLSFGMAHSPSAGSTSGESSNASTPVSSANGTGGFFHLQHLQLHRQQQPFHAGVMAHPRLHLNTMLAVDSSEAPYYTERDGGSPNSGHNSILSMSPACNFEAFSLHFDLPLKTAAEKFGVRATAFKKRCRAIGIRHWPYRKVRSLKRSLQELGRCHEQGALNDKQQYQYATFKKQLDKLMSPETYGIDPSGRITQTHFDDSDDESDDNESCASAAPSPRYGATFTDCSISPADGDKTFGDFSTPAHLRALRTKQSQQQFLQPPHFAKAMAPHGHFGAELALQRLTPSKEQPMGLYHKFPFGMYDPFPHDATGADRSKPTAPGTGAMRPHASAPGAADENDDMGERQASGAGSEPSASHDFLPAEMKYEDVRALNEADDEFTDHAATMDYTNDRFFDDVFLQISPDYGCLV